MADEKKVSVTNPAPKSGSGLRLSVVTAEFNPTSGARRDPSRISIEVTGNARTTVELTEDIMKNLSKFPGVTRENMKARFGANGETGDIGMYLAAQGPHLHKVRDWGTSLGMHMGSVFRQYQGLRPVTEVECDVTLTEDEDGQPCFAFNIFQGLAKKAEPVPGGRPKPEAKIKRPRKAKVKSGSGEVAATTENQ